MKHKPDASWNAGSTERRGVRQSLTRAGVQLGYAVTGALTSSLEALEERLQSEVDAGPPDSGGTAQSRMRELLNRDRAATRRGRAASGGRQADEQSAYGYTGKQSGGTARGRMKELLNKDRAMIATLDDQPFSDLFEESGTLPLPLPTAAIAPAAVAPPLTSTPLAIAPQAPVVPSPAAAVVAVIRAPVMVGIAGSARAGGPAPFATRPVPPPAVHAAPVVTDAAPVVVDAAPAPVTPAAPEPIVSVPAPVAVVEHEQPAVAAPAKPTFKAMPILRNQVPVGSSPVAAPAGDDADSPIRTRSMARLLALQGHRDRALSIYDDLLTAEPDNADLRAEAERLRG